MYQLYESFNCPFFKRGRSSRRKVLVQKSILIRQFIGESVMMAMIAFVFALVLTKALVHYSQGYKEISFFFQQHGSCWLDFIACIITGLLAGSYPFYLSSFQPVKVLKGETNSSLLIHLKRVGRISM
jgi:putative ABC transport system permease protein